MVRVTPTDDKHFSKTGLQNGVQAAMTPSSISNAVHVLMLTFMAHMSNPGLPKSAMMRFLMMEEMPASKPRAMRQLSTILSRSGLFRFHKKLIGASDRRTSVDTLTTAPVILAILMSPGGKHFADSGSAKSPQAALSGWHENRMNHRFPNPYAPARAMLHQMKIWNHLEEWMRRRVRPIEALMKAMAMPQMGMERKAPFWPSRRAAGGFGPGDRKACGM